jgi:hypothetical protein
MDRLCRATAGRSARHRNLHVALVAALSTFAGAACSGGPSGSRVEQGGSDVAAQPSSTVAGALPGAVPGAAPGTNPGSTPSGTDPGTGPAVPPAPTPVPTPAAPLRLSAARGLYLLDPPLAGESAFDGKVEVVIDGKAPPAGTVVELNGVPLVRETRNDDADRFWHVGAGALQPAPRADGSVTITARSGSFAGTIDLSCPPDVAVSSSTPAGASLPAATPLVLGWATSLPANQLTSPFATLRGLELATSTPSPVILAHQLLPAGTVGTSLPVQDTASTGYVAELRWQGPFQTNGTSDGFCGRAKRLVYAR